MPALDPQALGAGAVGTVEDVTAATTGQVTGVVDTAAGVATTADTTVRRTTAGVTGTAGTAVQRTAAGVSGTLRPTVERAVEAVRGAPKPQPVESAAGAVGVGGSARPGATPEASSPAAPAKEGSAERSPGRTTGAAPPRGAAPRSWHAGEAHRAAGPDAHHADGPHPARIAAPAGLSRTTVEFSLAPSRAAIGPPATAGPRPSASALQRPSRAPDRAPPAGGGSTLSGIPASVYFGGLALLAGALALAGPRLRRRLELPPASCLAPAFVALPERPG